jgi:hypothetical protein
MLQFKWQPVKTACIVYACLFTFTTLLYSCRQKRNKNDYLHAYENTLGIKPSKLAQIDTANFTTIEWLNPTRNFGTVKEGDSVIITFRCRNTGDNPLFLSEIHSPCGCTVPNYSEKPILPGEEDELPVYFNTAGQAGTVHKSIVVTSNTSNGAKHSLSFEGKVTEVVNPLKKK